VLWGSDLAHSRVARARVRSPKAPVDMVVRAFEGTPELINLADESKDQMSQACRTAHGDPFEFQIRLPRMDGEDLIVQGVLRYHPYLCVTSRHVTSRACVQPSRVCTFPFLRHPHRATVRQRCAHHINCVTRSASLLSPSLFRCTCEPRASHVRTRCET
jgi:hypothetical protein